MQPARHAAMLPPIPEAPDSEDPEGEHISACFAPPVIQHSDSDLSSAETEMQEQGDSIAVERQVTPGYRVTAWPAHREVRGELTLRGSANHPRGVRAVCSVQHCVLTLSCATSSSQRASARGESGVTVVAEVPVKDLAVGLQRGRVDMFTLATLHGETGCTTMSSASPTTRSSGTCGSRSSGGWASPSSTCRMAVRALPVRQRCSLAGILRMRHGRLPCQAQTQVPISDEPLIERFMGGGLQACRSGHPATSNVNPSDVQGTCARRKDGRSGCNRHDLKENTSD